MGDGMPRPVYDMRNTFIEHSIVINNFVTVVGSQLKNSLCRVFGDSVKYKWQENHYKPIIRDVSINCDIKNRRATNFLGVPRFVMEVLSDSTEEYDRGEKMRLYRDVEVAEYRLIRTITEENKKELQLYMFPSVRIDFEQLFADLD